jgi:POT family proton-dependent oligopeptide transporter
MVFSRCQHGTERPVTASLDGCPFLTHAGRSGRAMSATHPRALFVLCLVELLERTAGVLVAALLILFLTEARGLSTSDATALAGSFLALTYFTPLIGGLLTDRYLGTRAAMQLGALLSSWRLRGRGVRAPASRRGSDSDSSHSAKDSSDLASLRVWLACTFRTPELRDGGYSLFYLAVNIGGALGPLLGGAVKRLFGWPSVFVLASSLMALSVMVQPCGFVNLNERKNDYSRPATHRHR